MNSNIRSRILGYYQRTISEIFSRRPISISPRVPHISFTFDDFPRSALSTGASILMRYGIRATFYASFGEMGKSSVSGRIFTIDDLTELLKNGHELGCHTYDHCHSWETKPEEFEKSILRNKEALDKYFPGLVFRSFSYPIIGPRPDTKRRTEKYFESCRCGGQAFNVGKTDLNLLKAYFLEKSKDNPDVAKKIIDQNCRAGGWLIFATHDVEDHPSPYGCTPSYLEKIIEYSIESGSKILPVAEALDSIPRT